ncbi:SirB1 family protein [Herminiimonas sp. CN]|uniref:SirB1 family protein n=1 Tax=Herminiimonas sp. CN TaxID=1349818 RepID=UPI00047342D7|nr:tetratricopeptide repeat protein [Herminiimonas sp. CN]
MIQPLDYFATLVSQDDAIPLFEAALAVTQGIDERLDFGAVQATVDGFAATLQRRLAPDMSDIQKLRLLNRYFYRELGFGSNVNHFYDIGNSLLPHVIATRRGIPISLAVLFMEIAQQIGLRIKGIAFPGHFLMRLSVPTGEIILDPLSGSSLTREALEELLLPYVEPTEATPENTLAHHLHAAHPREILARMLRNLKSILVEEGNWAGFLAVQQRLVILLPDDIAERRDRGLAYANLSRPQPALQDLEAYLAQRPHASDAAMLREKLPALRDACKRPH